MSEAKFTKGPWEVLDNGSYYDIGIKCEHGGAVIHQGVCIGVMHYDKANANLIAAAPELYSALSSLLSRTSNDADAKHWWPDAQKVAKEALAKARGEHETP